MSKVYNILVFPGGTEIGLEVFRSLQHCKDVRLFSAGQDTSNHAPFVFLRHFTVPSIHDAGWINALNEVIVSNSIDYVIPAYDDIIVALASNADALAARIISSPLETCLLTRSKRETYRFFEGVVPTPRVYSSPEDVTEFPVFVKPDQGQGAEDTHLVNDLHALRTILACRKDMVIMEYLPGDEYTVDCFSDRDAGLLFCGGRQRVRTKSGISMSSRPVHDAVFEEYARAIGRKLVFHGAWFFQVKRNAEGVCTLLEIAPRIAGTMALHRVQGVNFPLLSIYEQERIPVSIMSNDAAVEIDRALTNRYRHDIGYGTVYVDLDDTLIFNGSVNVSLIAFIYQCINRGVTVKLLTRHRFDLTETLTRYRLQGICDEVIHIDQSCSKADYITEQDAILIDDSFSERKSVRERLGIPTFDCSMLELLVDERG